MNVLFLTIGNLSDIEQRGIYPDLLREFRNNGHSVYAVSAYEKRKNRKTSCSVEHGVTMLRVKIGNITKCGIIEKGISTIRIESQFIAAIKKYFLGVKFDLILYSTPPITFANVVKFIKKRDGAKSYLLLKDIFPQNAVDLGLMTKKGLKGILYQFFRKKEVTLYGLSDRIGCMSQANVDYVIKHNPGIPPEKIEICPNCIEIRDMSITMQECTQLRVKYNLPLDKKIFIYGGNLGKPQGIPFIIECLKKQKNNLESFFLIVGDGTEYVKLETFFADNPNITNMRLMKNLPKEDYDRLVAACDVGLIFLDHRFTIPNFPSRLLAYMQAGISVLACTDSNTDIGKVITDGGFGWWCESNDVDAFSSLVSKAILQDKNVMKKVANKYLLDNYSVNKAYKIITRDDNLS